MKKITYTFGVILFALVALTSCGSDDGPDDPVPVVITDFYKVMVDGTELVEGDTKTYSKANDALMDLSIKNNTAAPIFLKLELKSIIGVEADVDNIEICIGNCYTGVVGGVHLIKEGSYPLSTEGFELAANETSEEGFVHITKRSDTRSSDIILEFKLYQVDANGVEMGESLNFTYKVN